MLKEQLSRLIGEFRATLENRVQMVQAMIVELQTLFERHEAI